MRFMAMLAIAMPAGLTLQAAHAKKQQVTIYVLNSTKISGDSLTQAEDLTASMFDFLGVKIDWRSGTADSSDRRALSIELVANTVKTERPYALGYAELEAGRIVVFWGRIEAGPTPVIKLAHVMAHEITHVLEGSCRHSDAGIMKACWTPEDQAQMRIRPLPFAKRDIELIHAGLLGRNSSASMDLAANGNPATVASEK